MLSAAAFMPGCDAVELRYVAVPQTTGVARLQMFVTAREGSQEYGGQRLAAAAATAAVAALPPDFVRQPVTQRWMGMQPGSGDPIFELRRNEEVTFPTWEYIPAEFYYHISETPGDGSGWKRFWHAMSRVTSAATVSILFKQTELDPEERHVLGGITTQLAQFAVTRNDYDLLGYQTTYPGCENAAVALAAWQERMRLLQRPLLGRIAVRGDFATSDAIRYRARIEAIAAVL